MIKRLVFIVFMAFFSTFLCLSLMHFSKGSPAFVGGSNALSAETRAVLEKNLNLDKPLLSQYEIWLKKAFDGDLGYSFLSGEKISEILKQALPNTLILAFSSLFLLFILSVALGLLCLVSQSFDKLITSLSLVFFALPSFALGLIFIMIFTLFFRLLPSSGVADFGLENDFLNRLEHLILPVLTLVLSHLAVYLSVARASFVQSFHQSFILNAFARGLSGGRVYFHFLLKDAISPIISYFGANAIAFVMNAYIVESVFGYEGIGNLMIKSIIFKDYPLILALVFLSVLFAGFFSLMSDMICKLISPKNGRL